MKAKQVQVRKYTATQINMLVQRMVEDGKAQASKLAEQKSAEREARNKARLTEALKSLPTAQAQAIINNTNYGVAFRKAFKLEDGEGDNGWDLRNKVQMLGEDFKFKLTMAEHTDHEKHMQKFAAAVAKLLK